MNEIDVIDEEIFNEGNSVQIKAKRILIEFLNKVDGFNDLVDLLIKIFGTLP